jgi:hypothetical protein
MGDFSAATCRHVKNMRQQVKMAYLYPKSIGSCAGFVRRGRDFLVSDNGRDTLRRLSL